MKPNDQRLDPVTVLHQGAANNEIAVSLNCLHRTLPDVGLRGRNGTPTANLKVENNTMKRLTLTTCLFLCILAAAFNLSAQQQINFSQLPFVSAPSPMPSGYGRLNWANFFYVNPYAWTEAGPGYRLQPQTTDVVFVGGEFCQLSGYACSGSINSSTGFVLLTAQVAGGYGTTQVTVTAYNKGTFLGTAQYLVSPQVQNMNFPPTWGAATEVMFQVTGQPGSLVFYNLTAYYLGG